MFQAWLFFLLNLEDEVWETSNKKDLDLDFSNIENGGSIISIESNTVQN
jgi:hypothetical protein